MVEVMGGIEPTARYLLAGARGRASVVTANKQLLVAARRGAADARRDRGVPSCGSRQSACAAIPVIKVLRESMLAAEISGVTGIVNGTTNYILTEMAPAGAQLRRGAQAGPGARVRRGGPDRGRRRRRRGRQDGDPRVDRLPHQRALRRRAVRGHRRASPTTDVELARDLGFVVKLLGVARLADGGISVRVHPALVPERHRLAGGAGPTTRSCWNRAPYGRSCWSARVPAAPRPRRRCSATCSRSSARAKGSFLQNALVDAGRPLLRPGPDRSRASTCGSRSTTGPACWRRSRRSSPRPGCRSSQS